MVGLCAGTSLWMQREPSGIVSASLWTHRETSGIVGVSLTGPVNARGAQWGCTVSGDGPGVQRDWVGVCVCVSGGCRQTWVWVRSSIFHILQSIFYISARPGLLVQQKPVHFIPFKNAFVCRIRRKSALCSRILFASTKVMHTPRSDFPLNFDVKNKYQIRTEKYNASARRLLPATLLKRWPQFCRVKITLNNYPTIGSFAKKTISMKSFVNWIPVNTHVRSNQTQPCLTLYFQGPILVLILWFVKLLDKSSQLDKLTSLSSETCHCKWNLSPDEKKWLKIASASEKVFARFSGHVFCVLVCPKSVVLDGPNVKYDRDITTRLHLFHCTNSHEHSAHRDNRVNKTWKCRGRSTQWIVRGMSCLTYCLQIVAENPPTPQQHCQVEVSSR